MLSPIARYRQDLELNRISPDPVQKETITQLDQVYTHLLDRWQSPPSFMQKLVMTLTGKGQQSPTGLYLWGGVGRGKTYLMDLFFQCLPSERKLRMHFHRFMQQAHQGMNRYRGQANPLQAVAREMADGIDVICFDEFFVSDIGDAMILANLLETLFEEGVCMVATSNIVPDRLYENGLQRQKFLPAIDLLKHHMRVLNVDGGIDYRLRSLEQAEIYHSPLGEEADRLLADSFSQLGGGLETQKHFELDILGRPVQCRLWAEGLAWFDFGSLCDGPRSASDYIELARLFHTVFLSDIPQMGISDDDRARRFISLVDEFYDHKVKLISSAAVPLRELYTGSALAFPFQRTVSRLLEMQSHHYLALEHAP